MIDHEKYFLERPSQNGASFNGTGINFDDAINSIMSLETAEERAATSDSDYTKLRKNK